MSSCCTWERKVIILFWLVLGGRSMRAMVPPNHHITGPDFPRRRPTRTFTGKWPPFRGTCCEIWAEQSSNYVAHLIYLFHFICYIYILKNAAPALPILLRCADLQLMQAFLPAFQQELGFRIPAKPIQTTNYEEIKNWPRGNRRNTLPPNES